MNFHVHAATEINLKVLEKFNLMRVSVEIKSSFMSLKCSILTCKFLVTKHTFRY